MQSVLGLREGDLIRLRLFALSFLMLFLELALIRWTGSNVLYLAYFSNLILLASFLGIGVGFLIADRSINLFALAPVGLVAVVAFVRMFPVEIDRSGSELIFFGALGTRSGLPAWLMLPAIFLGVALLMALIGQGVARTFRRFPPLEAYRLDIAGSLAGIIAFSLLSFTGAPPVAWGLVVAAMLILLLERPLRIWQTAPLLLVVVLLAGESLTPSDSWSPYYKIRLVAQPTGDVSLLVNGVPHQTIESVFRRLSVLSLYGLPYQRLAQPPSSVLIVGAGTGDDVAIALHEGARHVDAVEIDPQIHNLGVKLHPDDPYRDPRVTTYINDGRAFLEQTANRYDLILFALPDSLTLVAGQSSIRLESYLFTNDAVAAARRHLTPNGAFGEYNYYRQSWLVDRLGNTLQQVYGRPPCLDSQGQSARLSLLMDSPSATGLECDGIWRAAADPPAPATDDYPFLYLQHRSIPNLYLATLALILIAAFAFVRLAGGSFASMGSYLDLFAMGAAFLLLETKNVVQFALLFGTTWFVNSLVFIGILLAVYLAIEVARRVELGPTWRLYLALALSLGLTFAIQPEWLLRLPVLPRFVAGVAIAFVPVFLANLIFAQRFRNVASSSAAFAANLLGAMVGGVLEYLSLLTGYRLLLLIVAGLYALAFAASRQQVVRAVAQT